MNNSKDEIIEREAEERINSLADEVFELGEFFNSKNKKEKKKHSLSWQKKYEDIFSKIFSIKYVNHKYKKYIEKYNNVRFKDKDGLSMDMEIIEALYKVRQVEFSKYSIDEVILACLRTSLERYDKSK